MVGLGSRHRSRSSTISQDDRRGPLPSDGGAAACRPDVDFLVELADDPDVDDDVKGSLAEIAQDADFLFALEEYVHRTRAIH
jgi:hypothetical protein